MDIETGIGHCKHGKFNTLEGCPQCVADFQAEKGNTDESIAEAIAEVNNKEPDTFELQESAAGAMEKIVEAVSEVDPNAWRIGEEEKRIEPATALINIGVGNDPKVIQLYEESQKMLGFASKRVIKSNEDMVPATNDLTLIVKARKAIEALRKEYVNPIRVHLDAVNIAFKNFTAPLVAAEALTRSQMDFYRAEVAKKQAEAEEINRKRAELIEAEAQHSGTGEFITDSTPTPMPEAALKRVSTEMGTVGTQKTYKFEVVDPTIVPREYLMVNTTLIGQVVRSNKGLISIPGVKVIIEESTRVNTR